jgi:hypothetical protein
MEKDYSFDAFLRFLEYVGDKGLMNARSAQGFRVAAAKIAGHVTDAERSDVRRLNVDAAFQKYFNRDGSKVTPSTLREYKRRVTAGVQEFLNWTEAPEGYAPRGRSEVRPIGKKPSDKARERRTQENDEREPDASRSVADRLKMPYPLRDDFLVEVLIPRNMTMEEAKRIGVFLTTLAVDFKA